jgi:hypothetical protein
MNKNRVWFLLSLLLLGYCATSYQDKMKSVETALYSGKFDAAVPEMRTLVTDSGDKDKLLFLMEAGVVLHTKRDYEASNKAFMQAEVIADTIKTSVTKEALSFLLSDNQSNFTGESFERVMIKLYIAINYLCLNKYEDAKRYFKKVDFEQKEMKVTDAKYKQNILARYLDSIASESLEKYNDARVGYKNALELDPGNKDLLGDRYVLASKEKDRGDLAKYAEGKNYVSAYDKSLQRIPYTTTLGEIIIVNQAGKAAVKESRGKLIDDPAIAGPLQAAIEASLQSNSKEGLTATGVIAMLGSAENPIPIYKERETHLAVEVDILVNGISVGKTKIMNDYSATAMSNFNDNYKSIVTKNIASIATKVIAAGIAAYAVEKSVEKQTDSAIYGAIAGFITGFISGGVVAASLSPDLRCWRTSPSNFQAKRIFIEPGEYDLSFKSNSGSTAPDPVKLNIESGKATFVTFRSF